MEELRAKIESRFHSLFKGDPIFIFSPGRINLIGEHVDYNDGYVFPAAIDKGIVGAIAISKGNSKVYASDLGEAYEFTTKEVSQQEVGSWKNYILGVVQEIKKSGREVPDFHMVFGGNIPEGAGLSSSAALENCVAFGLNQLFDLRLSKHELILISQRAEHNYVGVQCGIMDQFASMFGQKDKALLLDCRSMEFEAYDLALDDVELLLINSNVKHSLAESAYNQRRAVCEKTAGILGIKSLRDADLTDLIGIKTKLETEEWDMASFVIEEINRVKRAASYLLEKDLESFGKLMFETHEGLSKKYKVSCKELDFLVDLARMENGILGARLMGGGFGGCTINLIQRNKRDSFVEKVQTAYLDTFEKSCSIYEVRIGDGTRILSPSPLAATK